MLTAFGKELRKLRIDHDEIQQDMAARLGVSAPFLSAVETGRKKPPRSLVPTLASVYGLSADQTQRLQELSDQERK